jgi:methionine-rich copper-binding protein CopC
MKFKKLVILFALFLPGLAWPMTASAHTSLITQQPVGNSVIQELPSEISLTFDESLIVIGKANSITVLDPNGKEISTGETKVLNNVVSRSMNSSELTGKYSVTYRVVSEDGHVVSATYQFTLQSNSKSPVAPADPEPTTSSLQEPMPISSEVVEEVKKENSHTQHSFWGEHAGHFYILLASIFLIYTWKKYAK